MENRVLAWSADKTKKIAAYENNSAAHSISRPDLALEFENSTHVLIGARTDDWLQASITSQGRGLRTWIPSHKSRSLTGRVAGPLRWPRLWHRPLAGMVNIIEVGVHIYDQYNWYDQYVTLAYQRYRNRQLHIMCHINLHILHIS